MSEEEWLSRNTDGPDNPYSRVYDAAEAAALFAGFDIKRQEVFFLNLGRRWGWHRVVYARKPVPPLVDA
jgi:hypothetical protein